MDAICLADFVYLAGNLLPSGIFISKVLYMESDANVSLLLYDQI